DPICPLSYNVLATLDRVASSEGLVRIANLLCDRSTGDALRQVSPEFATQLFNRAHKHGSVRWEKVPNRSPEVFEVVKIVAVTITGPIFVRRQERPVEKARWRPARADVHAAIIDHDVQRRDVEAVPHRCRVWEDRDVVDGDRHCAQLGARTPARPVVVKHHHLHTLRRRTSTQSVKRQTHRRVSAWIACRGKLVGENPQYSWTALVPGLYGAIIMDHDTRGAIAVDTSRMAGNLLDRWN